MDIVDKRVGDVLVIGLGGKIMGGPESDKFRDLLYQAISDGIVNVVVDLSAASWMNSSGLGMLISGLTTLRSGGGDLRLVGLKEGTRRPLEVTRLDAVFQMFETEEEAIASFKE